jgi:hypothetical protein
MKTTALSAAVLLSGCATLDLGTGAKHIFSREMFCPEGRVTVQPKPDTAPHVLLGVPEAPPPEVAADPERLKLWQQRVDDQAQALDDSAATYELDGCGAQALYVCDHPRISDLVPGNGAITGDTSMSSGSRVLSAVRCRSDVSRQLELQAGAMGDVRARVNSPDVFKLPEHSAASGLPLSMLGLRVRPVEHLLKGTSSGSCLQLAKQLIEEVGWVPVADASQPHDVVMKSDCFLSATITTDSGMFVVLPVDVVGRTFETPDGKPIDRLKPLPSTLRCPGKDEPACTRAMSEFSLTDFVNQVSASGRLADYADQHRAN